MAILSRIRGLYRFDGDTEPVQLSRRSFFFVGGVLAAGAVLPNALPEMLWRGGYTGGAYVDGVLVASPAERAEYLRRLRKHMDLYRGRQWAHGAPDGEWIFLDGKVPTLG